MSSFLVKIEPERFGGKQQDYIKESISVVRQSVKRFRQAVAEGKDLTALFHETLSFMGDERRRIAVKHGSEEAESFGVRRDGPEFSGICSTTSMLYPYEQYNAKLLDVLGKYSDKIDDDYPDSEETQFMFQEELCFGRDSSTEVSILDVENLSEWALVSDWTNYQRICRICSFSGSKEDFEANGLEGLRSDKEAMRRLKEYSVEEYQKLKNTRVMIEMWRLFEISAFEWLSVTNYLEIDGRQIPTSQYFTWASCEDEEDRKRTPVVTICHQDLFLIDTVLNDIAKIFKKALECDRNDVKTLKSHVAHFQYEFAHTMPFIRGSSAVSEWFEVAIYRYHGYALAYNSKKLVNLEALTSTLKEFADSYDSMVFLKNLR